MSWSGEGYETCVAVHKSRHYHAMMRDFYRRCADLTTAISALSGTSAFVALFLADRASVAAKALTGIIAITSVLNLVFGFSKKADLHDTLCRRFTELAAEMAAWPETETNITKARTKRIRLEVDEPTVRRVIDLRAQNVEMRARGVLEKKLNPLSFLQDRTWLGYFLDFGLAGVSKRRAQRQDIETAHSAE